MACVQAQNNHGQNKSQKGSAPQFEFWCRLPLPKSWSAILTRSFCRARGLKIEPINNSRCKRSTGGPKISALAAFISRTRSRIGSHEMVSRLCVPLIETHDGIHQSKTDCRPLLESRVFDTAADAAKSVPSSGRRDWQSAGVESSRFHKDHTPFALPFQPDSYVWAGPFTLRLPEHHQQQRQQSHLGHFRRGVRKYLYLLAQGRRLPPVVFLNHDDGSWRMQDGNHRYEALVKSGATTFEAFLGRPKWQPAD